jgi:hypothetical protein
MESDYSDFIALEPSMRSILPAALLAAISLPAAAQERTAWRLDLEAGVTFQNDNSVRVDGRTSTRFDMNRLQGEPASPFFRATVEADPWQRHGFRFAYQYLRTEGSGALPGATTFTTGVFAPGVRTTGKHRFDTWRFTSRCTLVQQENVRLRIGVTGLIRDAEIRLTQGGLVRRDSDLGFVPLLHASFDGRIAPRVTLMGEIDALGASQGRAIDLGLRAACGLDRHWQVTGGWRFLDGGANNQDVFHFARFHTLTAGVAYRL